MDMPCPRCGAEQKFTLKRRTISDDLAEVYIKCKICRWVLVVKSDHPDKLDLRKDIERLKIRAKRDSSLKAILRSRTRRFRNE